MDLSHKRKLPHLNFSRLSSKNLCLHYWKQIVTFFLLLLFYTYGETEQAISPLHFVLGEMNSFYKTKHFEMKISGSRSRSINTLL